MPYRGGRRLHPVEIQNALDNAILLLDTREQDTPRLQARIRDIGWPVERAALRVGDYSAKFPLPSGAWLDLSDKAVIERKFSLDELIQCYTRERARFVREFERAGSCKIYLLIENTTWENVYAGKYRSQMQPKSLVASMLAWLARYNCQLLMCKAETGGKLIRDILYREAKEILENDEGDHHE